MWDFDGDEFAFFGCAAIVGLALAYRYCVPVLRVSPLGSRFFPRFLLAVWPIGCLFLIYWILQYYSDPVSVRGHPDYVTLFMCGGAVWVFGSAAFLSLLGISVRDNAIERNNPAAAIVAIAVMLGAAICYAAANIGTGPTIWTTIVPALMAAAALVICAVALQMATGVSDIITIDRDIACGWIVGAWCILCSVDLAWAVAGDWVSWDATVDDFIRRAWPMVGLTLAAIVAIGVQRRRSRFQTLPIQDRSRSSK